MGDAEFQVMNGMAGMIIVEGILTPFPTLSAITEQIILLKDFQNMNGSIPTQIDSNQPTNRLVNGLVNPTLSMTPGALQFWRIGNVGSDIWYMIIFGNNLTFYEVARDGNRHNSFVAETSLFIPPSSRIELLIYGPPSGTHVVTTLALTTGPNGDSYPQVDLLTISSSGAPVTPIAIPTNIPVTPSLIGSKITTQRVLIFSETADGLSFFLDGIVFNATRVDKVATFGDIEEWEIFNSAAELHLFHIHQLAFQVTEYNYQPVPFNGRQDTVTLPFADQITNVPGQVKIIIPFTNPNVIGTFLYHCHILRHEDAGMMGVIQVNPASTTLFPPTSAAPATSNAPASASNVASASASASASDSTPVPVPVVPVPVSGATATWISRLTCFVVFFFLMI